MLSAGKQWRSLSQRPEAQPSRMMRRIASSSSCALSLGGIDKEFDISLFQKVREVNSLPAFSGDFARSLIKERPSRKVLTQALVESSLRDTASITVSYTNGVVLARLA